MKRKTKLTIKTVKELLSHQPLFSMGLQVKQQADQSITVHLVGAFSSHIPTLEKVAETLRGFGFQARVETFNHTLTTNIFIRIGGNK